MFFNTVDGIESQPPSSSFSLQPCRQFQFLEIQQATNDFDESLVIGHGGFGKVYKGNIVNGSDIVVAAIKRYDTMSYQGAAEFRTEVRMLSRLRHNNIVSLIGYCNYENEMNLVYEYMPNGALHDHLHILGTPLSWLQRLKICIGVARGLQYLHTGEGIKGGVMHRDVKSSNILLQESWEAKITDFGLSKVDPTNQSKPYLSTSVKGTFGYMDPDYYNNGRLTRKSDVSQGDSKPSSSTKGNNRSADNPDIFLDTRKVPADYKNQSLKELKFVDLKNATSNSSPKLRLGEEGLGEVFLGWVDKNTFAPSTHGVGKGSANQVFKDVSNGRCPPFLGHVISYLLLMIVTRRDNFEARGRPCVFVGYPHGQKGYRVYEFDPIEKRIMVSGDTKFVEGNYPFKDIKTGPHPQNEDEISRMDTSVKEDPCGSNLDESHREPTCDQSDNEPNQNLTPEEMDGRVSNEQNESVDETKANV
ncbi:probable serine/threonine-protein kinase At1g01540 [Cynara cardunculus var. scolymus]|uniref:probable serine/threonine-protein kinase At1g01540 n=1 Tax=Cynara cardunculus var. scolymus TaxID=59895 RepID=UPI000D6247C4|nr:probable serine/threonine-protein kinase At1g01540 [Cynara cardunculus var. scolymus]